MTSRLRPGRKRLLIASVGVATVSFACGSKSERYGTFTSGNLVAVPIEASADNPAAPDAGSQPSPPPDAGAPAARP